MCDPHESEVGSQVWLPVMFGCIVKNETGGFWRGEDRREGLQFMHLSPWFSAQVYSQIMPVAFGGWSKGILFGVRNLRERIFVFHS